MSSYASDIRSLLRRVGAEAEQARDREDWLQLGQLVGLGATLRAEFAAEKVAQSGDVAVVPLVSEEHLP